MIKANFFIKGCSLKNRCNDEHYFLINPRWAGLEVFYATLLISTMEQPLFSINALPKGGSNSS